jgi:hypothetical protein
MMRGFLRRIEGMSEERWCVVFGVLERGWGNGRLLHQRFWMNLTRLFPLLDFLAFVDLLGEKRTKTGRCMGSKRGVA